MFSSQKNVLETIALLKAYNISQVVLSPGSRNTPFIHSFTQDPFFETHLIVDERKHGIASAKIECSYLCEREK